MSFPRYPEYKDSGVEWLGEVPAHWATLKLKHLARIRNGRDYKAVEVESEGYPVIGSGGPFSLAHTYLYDGESLLLGRKGTVDKPLYVNGPFWTVDTMFYTELSERVSGRFLYFYATCFQFDMYSTNTALPSMAQEDLANIELAVPRAAEQAIIAAFLDHETARIDALVAEQQRLIELLKEKRQAVISHAVTKGLNPDVPMKDSGVEWLGEVPAYWDVVRMRFLCDISTGDKDTQDAQQTGKYPFFVRSETIERSDSYSFEGEGVFTSGDGAGVGKIFHHFYGKCAIHQRVYLFHNFNGVSGRLFFNFLKSKLEPVVLSQSAKSTVDSLRLPMLQNFWMTRPAKKEQEEICQYVDKFEIEVETLLEESKKSIALLQERRSALISAAVTGKIDVRGWQPPLGSPSPTETTATEPA